MFKTRLRFKSFSRRAKWVIYPTAAIAWVNFVLFVAVATHTGGDALNGYTRAGHYFVCEHGTCTEVSAHFWRYSYWHATLSFIFILLVFAQTALFLNIGDIAFE
jgi:hypothetical protein